MFAFDTVSGSEENDGMVTTKTAIVLIVGVNAVCACATASGTASDTAKSLIAVTGIFVVFTPLSVAK
jgi:hypothetical protein